jgi:putative spermidine/putrescine transport system substrate-binding protein
MSGFTIGGMVAAAGFLVLIAGGARADISVVSWGGAYTESQQKAYGETWERKTGHKIRWLEYNGDLAEVRAQVEAGEVTWDVVDVFAQEARTGCNDGLFEKLPHGAFQAAPDGTPMKDDLIVPRPNGCVAPNIIWSWLTFYDDTKLTGHKPRMISDFFDFQTFPGKRGLSAFPQANIEMALVADGVDPEKVYDVMNTREGIDRAFAKLATLEGNVVFWSSGAEPLDLVKSGRVVISTAYNGRVSSAMLTDGEPFVPIWDGQVLDEEWFVIVKGTENYDEAVDFLAHVSASQQQAAQAKWIAYGPMRKSALEIIAANEPWYVTGERIMPHMPDRAEVMPRTVVHDPDWWVANGAEVSRRYIDWMKQQR